MGRDARLAHPRDLLQLVDRQFVLLQQRHDAQARRVGQGAEGFEGGAHGADFCEISVDGYCRVIYHLILIRQYDTITTVYTA